MCAGSFRETPAPAVCPAPIWRARLNRHLAHPDHSTGEVQTSQEMDSAAVVARGDMPKMLEFVEEAFDAVTQPVGDGVMRNDSAARGFGRDNGFCARFGDEVAERIAVVSVTTMDEALDFGMRLSG